MDGSDLQLTRLFLEQCLSEGIDDDAIVVLARSHKPTVAWCNDGGFDLDSAVDRRLQDLRTPEHGERHSRGLDVLPFLEWGENFEGEVPAVQYCIPGLVQQGDLVSVVGAAKVGKSLLALEAAAAKASGRAFLGQECPPGSIVYWDCENNPTAVRRRLEAMNFQGIDLHDLHYVSMPRHPRLDDPAGAKEALRLVHAVDAKLFVIDTAQRVIGGDEESSQGIRDMYRHFIAPMRNEGRSVLRLDHLGKNPDRGARGSSAKVDDVDEAYQLTSGPRGLLELRRTHSRSGIGLAQMLLRRSAEPLRHDLVFDDHVRDPSTGGGEHSSPSATSQELVNLLDRAQVSNSAGRPTAAGALKAAGVRYRTEALAEAVKRRKSRG